MPKPYMYFRSPDGEKVRVYNLAKFCRENELNTPAMHYVNSGAQLQHKGWSKYQKGFIQKGNRSVA